MEYDLQYVCRNVFEAQFGTQRFCLINARQSVVPYIVPIYLKKRTGCLCSIHINFLTEPTRNSIFTATFREQLKCKYEKCLIKRAEQTIPNIVCPCSFHSTTAIPRYRGQSSETHTLYKNLEVHCNVRMTLSMCMAGTWDPLRWGIQLWDLFLDGPRQTLGCLQIVY